MACPYNPTRLAPLTTFCHPPPPPPSLPPVPKSQVVGHMLLWHIHLYTCKKPFERHASCVSSNAGCLQSPLHMPRLPPYRQALPVCCYQSPEASILDSRSVLYCNLPVIQRLCESDDAGFNAIIKIAMQHYTHCCRAFQQAAHMFTGLVYCPNS